MADDAGGTAQRICGSDEAKLLRVGRGDGRNHTRRTMGAPPPPFHSSRKRSEHGISHPRNHRDSAPVLPHVDVQGGCRRRPHGAAYASRSHQPAGAIVSAIAAWRRSSLAEARIRMTASRQECSRRLPARVGPRARGAGRLTMASPVKYLTAIVRFFCSGARPWPLAGMDEARTCPHSRLSGPAPPARCRTRKDGNRGRANGVHDESAGPRARDRNRIFCRHARCGGQVSGRCVPDRDDGRWTLAGLAAWPALVGAAFMRVVVPGVLLLHGHLGSRPRPGLPWTDRYSLHSVASVFAGACPAGLAGFAFSSPAPCCCLGWSRRRLCRCFSPAASRGNS